MVIYTSYFARASKLPQNIIPISISRFPPKGYHGYKYSKLAPTESILREWKNGGTEEKYISDYRNDVLSKLDPVVLCANLEKAFPGKDVALLCYEKSGDFCHRNLVRDWFLAAGIEAKEWLPESNQYSLFQGDIIIYAQFHQNDRRTGCMGSHPRGVTGAYHSETEHGS